MARDGGYSERARRSARTLPLRLQLHAAALEPAGEAEAGDAGRLAGRRLRFRDIFAFRDERRLFALARSRRQVSDGGAEELRCAA